MTFPLSVAIGTYNRLDRLRRCLDSITGGTRLRVRILVSDAGSTDGTIEYLQERASEDLIVVLEGCRRGQAAALNDLLARVDSPYFCWLSDDNTVLPNGLDTAVGILESVPRLGMVGLKVKDVAGRFKSAPYIGGISSVGILNVNQGVLRTELARRVGGFSTAFRDYGIDPDLTAKVLLSGHDVALTRGVAVHHHRDDPGGTGGAITQVAERQRAAGELYRRKYATFLGPAPLWLARRWLWRTLSAPLSRRLDSQARLFGLIPRDWHNVMMSRFISPLDDFYTRGRPYHLVQRCPARLVPRALPPDPQSLEPRDAPVHASQAR